jgi:hypothetical protein
MQRQHRTPSGTTAVPLCAYCPPHTAARSTTRRMLLAVDASGRVVLMAASSGHMMMVQQVTAGPPLAVNINSESCAGMSAARVLLCQPKSRHSNTTPLWMSLETPVDCQAVWDRADHAVRTSLLAGVRAECCAPGNAACVVPCPFAGPCRPIPDSGSK